MIHEKRKRLFFLIFTIHILVFFILYFFYLNNKYYGFEAPIKINSFELEDHNGNSFSEKNLAENFHFVYFGFLHCDEICPRGVGVLTKLASQISDPNLHFLFVSIDPLRDTKESLNTFMQTRDKRFLGIRDDDSIKLENFAGQLNIQFSREIFSKNKPNYQLNHSSTILLVHKSLTKMLQYPEGMEQIERIKTDYQKFKME